MVIKMRCPACEVEGMTKIYERTSRSGTVKAFWFCKSIVEGFEHIVYTEGKDGELFYKTVDRWSTLHPLVTLSKEMDEGEQCDSMIQLGAKKYLTRCQRLKGHKGSHSTSVRLYQLESEEKVKNMNEDERLTYYIHTINQIEKLIKDESKRVNALSNKLTYFMLKIHEYFPTRTHLPLDCELADIQSDNLQPVSSYPIDTERAYSIP